ncbi:MULTISPECIES: tyrosine-type recombinase/integrase [Streptomyces]|nr:integrase [Kitasatospora aureofaciens]KOT41790.1 integrase [Streptomyces sp. NRRL WC-3701]KOT43947.1 integrase [Streptomyces rimosus subsp. rimosus]KOT67284.1 integrase [Streptomyces rimosus subsp. rimosus]KOT69892.1 integrase [Streptomyces rimosus subsp. rimosus]
MSYHVRFWDIRERPDRRKPFEVRWTVSGRERSESFLTKGLAESRRAKLMTAARDGEPFDVRLGLPASEIRALKQRTTWYSLVREYIDQRWDRTPGNTRRTLADALATITPALVEGGAAYREPRVLRRALYSWAFNKNAWATEPREEWQSALDWLQRYTLPVSELEEPDVLRRGLDALCSKLDGNPAAAKTVKRKKAAINEVFGVAVERGYFAHNPLAGLRWVAPAVADEVDPDCVPNPAQVARLLTAVAAQPGRGPHLHAFFGCMYYAAMRPAEVIHLREAQCRLPATGWGLLNLKGGVVTAGKEWTNDGSSYEIHSLKRRAAKATRPVPIPPSFVAVLRGHIERFGVAPDGRLFRNQAGNYVDISAYNVTWRRARETTLTLGEQAQELARRPYDLRHAGISFWLASGVDPAECARRAGQSIQVLFRYYAKFLAEARDHANHLIEESMRRWDGGTEGAVGG